MYLYILQTSHEGKDQDTTGVFCLQNSKSQCCHSTLLQPHTHTFFRCAQFWKSSHKVPESFLPFLTRVIHITNAQTMSSGDISALSDVTTTGASAELGSHAKQQSDANIDEEMETNSNNAAVGDDNDAAVGEDADADTPVSASKAKPNKRSDNAARSNFRLSGQSP